MRLEKTAPLRDEGIPIVGSGNLVHNLHIYAWGRHLRDPYDWALRFESVAKQMMLGANSSRLSITKPSAGCGALDSDTRSLSPLLYVLGAGQQGERVRFPVEGVDGGSISMLTVEIG